eukprot:14748992-Alexandrium_andersonii.AAC.1
MCWCPTRRGHCSSGVRADSRPAPGIIPQSISCLRLEHSEAGGTGCRPPFLFSPTPDPQAGSKQTNVAYLAEVAMAVTSLHEQQATLVGRV